MEDNRRDIDDAGPDYNVAELREIYDLNRIGSVFQVVKR